MSFSDYYFKRFKADARQIATPPQDDLFIICVVPVFNEPKLEDTLISLSKLQLPRCGAEIIFVVNCPENSSACILDQNKASITLIEKYAKTINSNIKIHTLDYPALPKKHAGAGLARKKGMDEALHRFNFLNKPHGIITCTDADCLVDENYFIEIEKFFKNNPQARGGSVHFEHRVFEEGMSADDSKRIMSYELHLRYLNQALRYVKFPYAFQTIGSAFAVRADVYASLGGMNKRKAGEDFYFLHKVIEGGGFHDIADTCIYPSSRSSDRVPFGTGAAVKGMVEQNNTDFFTYNFNSFLLLNDFLKSVDKFFYSNIKGVELDERMLVFLGKEGLFKDIENAKKISRDIATFTKHFFARFNAFKVVKFLNYSKANWFDNQPTIKEASKLYDIITKQNNNINDYAYLLKLYRELERTNIFNN